MSFEVWTENELERLAQGTSLRSPSPYQSLFRYVSLSTKTSWDRLERTFQRSELAGATSHSLNDPFELSPYRFNDISPLTTRREFSLKEILRDDDETITEEERLQHIVRTQESAKDYLDSTIRDARIVAFCDQSEAGPLWSHYAASYSGACLHFIARAFKRQSYRLGFVNYSRHRPTYPLSLAASLSISRSGSPPNRPSPARLAESYKMLFFTKSIEWSYEGEARIIFNSKSGTHVGFEPDGLVSVIIGPKMSEGSKSRLRSVIGSSIYAGIPIREARLSATTFSVDTGELPESALSRYVRENLQ